MRTVTDRASFLLGLGACTTLVSCMPGGRTASGVVPGSLGAQSAPLSTEGERGHVDGDFTKKLRATFSSADSLAARRLFGKIVADPALAVLASSTLQANAANLTGFQTSLLRATGILMRDPAALTALTSGAKLTRAQRRSLESISRDLDDNPASRTINRTAAALRDPDHAALLRQYVTTDLAGGAKLGGANTTLGNAALDAVVGDTYALVMSSAFTNSIASVVPLLQSADFLTFLRGLPPDLIASVIPDSVVLTLMLPVDRDPPLSQSTLGAIAMVAHAYIAAFTFMKYLGEAEIFFAAAALVLTAPLDLEIVLALWVSSILIGSQLASATKNLYQAIDCDRDGDPTDSNDVPGIEC